ncbi:TPA: hypothetical protein DCW61_05030 [Candidatus Uhrbacteria bacterium]|nr:hypothetical protein [Candidatus Uhrbacteria bacterium]
MQRLSIKMSASFLRTVLLAVVVFFVFFFSFSAHPTFAQQTAFEQFGEASTLPTDDIAIIVARVIRAVFGVVGIIFTCLVIYAGFLYFLARGEPEPVKKSKKILQQSIVGLIIMFSAYGITTFILDRLLEAVFTGDIAATAEAYSEPLSGALGGGVIDDHYPERNAQDIPRNTRIFVSFKEAIDPASLIEGYESNPDATDLNIDSVLIYPTADGSGKALSSDQVVTTFDEEQKVFVFDPVGYLGSADKDMNYTVTLTTEIQKADGSDAFTGAYSSGYEWTFEVSTEIDLTPPYITSVIPKQDAKEPRNVTIEINFSEAMDPVASTGSYLVSEKPLFTNIQVFDESGKNVEGTFEISNGYRTVSFTTIDACGEDPCGDTIYCLPTNQLIRSLAKAATLNETEVPQAKSSGVTFDGLVDSAANSLDGDHDGDACGSELDTISCKDGGANDHYQWTFTTTDEVNDTVPEVVSLRPGIEEDEISQTNDVEITFNTFLKSSTVKTDSASLWPDPYYQFWFAVRKENNDTVTVVHLEHPTLVSTDEGGWDYWPVLTHDIKSAYQICMYPAIGPDACLDPDTGHRSSNAPYCCNGVPSISECQTDTQNEVGGTLYPVPDDYVLPNNTETEL